MKSTLSTLVLFTLLSACNTVTPNPVIDDRPLEESPAEETSNTLQVALVAIEDNGANGQLIGCGDSVVLVEVEPEDDPMQTAQTASKVSDALDALFAIEGSDYGESGLYNALYQSNLTTNSVSYSGSTMLISLSGSITSGGTCDDPRIEQQIRATAAANAPAGTEITIVFDGEDLHEYFDMSGL